MTPTALMLPVDVTRAPGEEEVTIDFNAVYDRGNAYDRARFTFPNIEAAQKFGDEVKQSIDAKLAYLASPADPLAIH